MGKTIEEWFDEAGARQKAQLLVLRSIIMATVPDAVEALKWGQPCYSRNGLFCYLQRSKAYVTLGFQKGASMHDPQHALHGDGRQMRHITFNANDEVDGTLCSNLIKEAINLD
jgi:hypothetical protein